jgi:hypothetical protein
MLAKMTSKNQITLPKAVVGTVQQTEYFDVKVEDGRIILTPVRFQQADAVRTKLAELGIREKDVGVAVKWTRRQKRRAR